MRIYEPACVVFFILLRITFLSTRYLAARIDLFPGQKNSQRVGSQNAAIILLYDISKLLFQLFCREGYDGEVDIIRQTLDSIISLMPKENLFLGMHGEESPP